MNYVKILNKRTSQHVELTTQCWEVITSTEGMKVDYEYIADVKAPPTTPLESDNTQTRTETTADLNGKIVTKKS